MKILLTGATGFIGSAFVRLAIRRGHKVAGLALPSEIPPPDLSTSDNLIWLRGTLEDAPWEAIDAFQPEVCLHTAWITTPGTYLESPENYRFLESSRTFLTRSAQAGIRRIFALGTCIEYQISEKPLSEALTPIEPSTTYARCKNELRLWLEVEAANLGVRPCWGRVFYPYGPREHSSRLCSSIIKQLRADEPVSLKTPDSTKDYIFIEDLADAIVMVLERDLTGSINLGTGNGVSVREIARTLASLLGRGELIREIACSHADPFGHVVADAGRLTSLGWKPAHNLRQGLEKLISFTGT